MMRSRNNLYATLATGATLATLAGCTVPPRAADAPVDCPHRSKALETIVNVATEPLVWPDEVLQGTGEYLITGSRSNDLMSGGKLVRDGDDSIYDGHGESVGRGWIIWGRTNGAAALLIYGATQGGSSSSPSAPGPDAPPTIDVPYGPGIR